MYKDLKDVIAPNEKRLSIPRFSHLSTLLLVLCLSACMPLKQPPVVIDEPKAPAVAKSSKYDASPIVPAPSIDVRFAQEALSKIGYKIGGIDGLWGPRSASAIRTFESKNKLKTANGHLSALNLHQLEIVSGLSRKNYGQLPIATPLGILAKLDQKTPLSAGPQLIIVDREYKVLTKPNPYSSELLRLAPGTGIYVISKQDGYFEVESINRKRGYVRID
jgi:peptidoglycan hydrolase-like protein with peptidoglycan-binding domain